MKAKCFPNLRKPPRPEEAARQAAERKTRASEEKMCLTKRGYVSETAALKQVEQIKRRMTAPEHLRAYKCPLCVFWHLTRK